MEPIETIISGGNHAVLRAHNYWRGLGPIQTCNSGAKHAVLLAQSHG